MTKIKFAILSTILLPLLIFSGCTSEGKFVSPFQDSPVVSTNSVGQVTTNVVSIVAPEWLHTIDAVKDSSALVPPPYGTWIGLGAAGVSSILGLIARSRQKKAEDVASTIISGIETMGDNPASNMAKESISKAASIKGNSTAVHVAVKKITK